MNVHLSIDRFLEQHLGPESGVERSLPEVAPFAMERPKPKSFDQLDDDLAGGVIEDRRLASLFPSRVTVTEHMALGAIGSVIEQSVL